MTVATGGLHDIDDVNLLGLDTAEVPSALEVLAPLRHARPLDRRPDDHGYWPCERGGRGAPHRARDPHRGLSSAWCAKAEAASCKVVSATRGADGAWDKVLADADAASPEWEDGAAPLGDGLAPLGLMAAVPWWKRRGRSSSDAWRSTATDGGDDDDDELIASGTAPLDVQPR